MHNSSLVWAQKVCLVVVVKVACCVLQLLTQQLAWFRRLELVPFDFDVSYHSYEARNFCCLDK